MKRYNPRAGIRFSDTIEGIRTGIHTFYDWGAYLLSAPSIENPAAKTYEIDVPFHNGTLDVTNFYSDEVFYNNRKLTFQLKFIGVYDRWAFFNSLIANELNGKKKYICIDEDNRFYYYGRLQVDPFQTDRSSGVIAINAIVEPYKREVDMLEQEIIYDGKKRSAWLWDTFSFVDSVINDISHEIDGTGQIVHINLKMPVKPFMRSTKNATITIKGEIYNITGDNKWHEMEFYLGSGENVLNIVTSEAATVSIKRRGGVQ